MAIYRMTLNITNTSAPTTHNVLHWSGSGSEDVLSADFDDALGELAAASHLLWPCPDDSTMNSISTLDVGSTEASFDYNLTNDQTGGASGDPIWQAAGIVSIKTNTRGPRGRGRIYLGPCAEDANDSGNLDPTGMGVCQTAWNDLRASMALDGWSLGVYSRTYSTFAAATSVTVRDYIATQRRRARFLQS